MKKFKLYLLSLTVLSGMGFTSKKDSQPQTFAVIVGVSRFEKKGITALKYADADANAYYNFLRSPKGGAVPEENIKVLSNEQVTRSEVLGQLRRFSDLAGPEDVLIFYISTHGVPDAKIKTSLYYAMYDFNPENPWGTGLKKEEIIQQQQSSAAKIKLLFSDACHSGGSGISTGMKDVSNDLINKLQASQGAVREPSYSILAASTAAEQSYEHQKWGNGHGAFTYFMIKGLEGEADKKSKYTKGDANGIITLRELYDYLYNIVPLETSKLQHPEMQSANPDIIPLAATLPGKYIAAVASAPRQEPPAESALTAVQPSASAIVSGFGPEETFVTLPDNEAYSKLNSTFFNCFGKCAFLNNLGESIIMYRGICTSNNVGETKNVTNIGNGRKGTTEALMIGLKEYTNGTPNVENATFKFYFTTADPGKPRRYGTISLPVKVGFRTQIALDKENLRLTESGERDQSYLRYGGLQ